MPIRGFIKGTDKFPIQKCAIFRKFKEIKELRGGILLYAAQAIPPIDAEIAEKGHLWTETSYASNNARQKGGSKTAYRTSFNIYFPDFQFVNLIDKHSFLYYFQLLKLVRPCVPLCEVRILSIYHA